MSTPERRAEMLAALPERLRPPVGAPTVAGAGASYAALIGAVVAARTPLQLAIVGGDGMLLTRERVKCHAEPMFVDLTKVARSSKHKHKQGSYATVVYEHLVDAGGRLRAACVTTAAPIAADDPAAPRASVKKAPAAAGMRQRRKKR
jgi:hypothetical protein